MLLSEVVKILIVMLMVLRLKVVVHAANVQDSNVHRTFTALFPSNAAMISSCKPNMIERVDIVPYLVLLSIAYIMQFIAQSRATLRFLEAIINRAPSTAGHLDALSTSLEAVQKLC